MMYFSRMKTTIILAVCLLGVLLGVPNLFPAPASWMPWRTVHLGLDLRGGSYLLLEVDMKAVIKERLDSLMDGVRQDLRNAQIFYQSLDAQPDQNRIVLRLRDAAKTDDAVAALRPLISQDPNTGQPDMSIGSNPDGTITLTLSPTALSRRASGAVEQSIEIIRRRIDETGVVDPQITRQGESRIVVQLPGVGDPDRIKQLIGKTAHMTFRLVDETANPNGGGAPPPGDDYLVLQDRPGEKIAVRKRIDVDGADLTDARAGTSPETGDWVVNFTFNSVGARRFADVSRANVNHRFAIVLDDKVISAPVIREAITGGRGQISGSFTAQFRQRPRGAAARRRSAGAADGGGAAQRRSRTRRRQHPGGGDLAGRRVRLRHRLHGDFLRPVRLVREPGAGGQPVPDAGHHVAAAGDADLAGHGGNPADARHGGGRQHPDQRAHPRGAEARPPAACRRWSTASAAPTAPSSTATPRPSWRT